MSRARWRIVYVTDRAGVLRESAPTAAAAKRMVLNRFPDASFDDGGGHRSAIHAYNDGDIAVISYTRGHRPFVTRR